MKAPRLLPALLATTLALSLTNCASLVDGAAVRTEGPREPAHPAQDENETGGQADQNFEREIEGYGEEPRQVGTPTDVDRDLATSFPKKDSVFGGRIPTEYFSWKEQLYKDSGIKLGISYQTLVQRATDTDTAAFPIPPSNATDTAASGWLLVEGKWEAYNSGQDYQGGLTFALDWRHLFGSSAEGAFFQSNTGSLWPTDFTGLEWDPWFPVLFWEQWAAKDRFVARVGTQSAFQIWDFFRFKDGRTSFTSSQFTTPVASISVPPPGLGVAFESWPNQDSPLYVVGTINDMNAEVGSQSWDNAFDYGQFFYGLEVGYNWKRSPTDFDHAHLNLFYADERDTAFPVFPNSSGWGFKVAGSKQWDQIVGFGNYTYNTAEGGGFGVTVAEQAVNLGVARLKPFGIRGEAAIGASWAKPMDDFNEGLPTWGGGSDQYGFETYWKILVSQDLWITPGVQVIFDPTFNTDTDVLTVATIKARLFL